MPRPESSLFKRLVALIVAVLGFGAGILMTAAWYYARTAADAAYDRLLLGAALQISESITVENGSLSADIPVAPFEMLGLSPDDRVFYRVVGIGGDTVTGYPELSVDRLAASNAGPMVVGGSVFGVPVRIAAVGRRLSDPDVSGWAHVLVAQTLQSRNALARELILRALALVAVMSCLAVGGVVLAVRLALSPLRRVEAVLRERGPQDLTPIDMATPVELVPFVDAINRFTERLRLRMDMLQRFVADAAHQIRTPLTALGAQVELLSDVDLSDKNRQHLERIRQRASQLARLTNQLLSHALVIHRTETVSFEPVNLAEIGRLALREAVPASLPRDIAVSLETSGEAPVLLGDRISLREALANVIGNAVRHGAPSRLAVRIRGEADRVVAEVEDDGPGIPKERWQEVMMRFGGSGGGGLGFSIAADVCRAHRGTLRFRNDPQGFVVELAFPRHRVSHEDD